MSSAMLKPPVAPPQSGKAVGAAAPSSALTTVPKVPARTAPTAAPLPPWAKALGFGLLGLWLYSKWSGKSMGALFQPPNRPLKQFHVLSEFEER
ncbi:MAG: hypothetical protein KA310_03455 [Pseudomonadales bacterium]|nr:hypothetical protein [Pseudomonadales bacterium]